MIVDARYRVVVAKRTGHAAKFFKHAGIQKVARERWKRRFVGRGKISNILAEV